MARKTQSSKPSLEEERWNRFLEEYKVCYMAHRGTFDMEREPDLFGCLAENYYRMAKPIPTNNFREFFNIFKTDWPSPHEWESAVFEYMNKIRPPEKELPPPTKQEQSFATSICRAIFLPNKAAKFKEDDNFDIHLGRALLMKILHDKFKKPFPNYWKNILDAAKPLTVEVTDRILKEYLEHEKRRKENEEFKQIGGCLD